jgi:hypothetical protein
MDAQLIGAVQAELSAIESHALYPAYQVMERRDGRSAFQATYNFIDFHNEARLHHGDGLAVLRQKAHDKFHAPLNHAFVVDRVGGTVAMRVEYDGRYFEAGDIERLNQAILRCLAGFTIDVAGPISAMSEVQGTAEMT